MKQIAAILPAMLVISIVAYEMCDHYYMSHDLRRSLMAVSHSHTTWVDEQLYMREARVQVRTAHDREVFEAFQSAVTDLFEHSRCGEDLKADLDQINLKTQNLQAHFEAGLLSSRNAGIEKKSIGVQIDAAKSTYEWCQGAEDEARNVFKAVRDRYGLDD